MHEIDEKTKGLMEVQAFQTAFGYTPKNPDKLTKYEKAQLERYYKSPITREEFNRTLSELGRDFGRMLVGFIALERYVIETIGQEKYAELRKKASELLQAGAEEDQNDKNPPTSDAQEETSNHSPEEAQNA